MVHSVVCGLTLFSGAAKHPEACSLLFFAKFDVGSARTRLGSVKMSHEPTSSPELLHLGLYHSIGKFSHLIM